MDLDAIQDEMRRLEACIEQVREDFIPKFAAVHDKYWPYVGTNRYPKAVQVDQRRQYKDEYMRVCASLMGSINVYSNRYERLRVQVLEHQRRERMGVAA